MKVLEKILKTNGSNDRSDFVTMSNFRLPADGLFCRSFLLGAGCGWFFSVVSRADHHGSALQSVIPTAPTEPNDAYMPRRIVLIYKVMVNVVDLKVTLSGGQILRIGQIDAVESSTAGFPPPAALEHGGAVQTGSVVVPVQSRIYISVLSLFHFTTDERQNQPKRKFFLLPPSFSSIFFLTDCMWRMDSSWSRTKDR